MKLSRAGIMVLTTIAWFAAPPARAQVNPPLQRMEAADLCVTNGSIAPRAGGRFAIDTPSSRAVVQGATASVAEIRFRYIGPSLDAKPLASGETRRQIGLKLLAQDSCNLLYAVWRIEPEPRFVVSLKRNPGMTTHEQCGANGYVNIRPRVAIAAPRLLPGEQHVFRAELRGDEMTATADGAPVWSGAPGQGLAGLAGPAGLRTDNARFDFEFLSRRIAGKAAGAAPCKISEGD